jgi:hypothetical protein
VFSHTEEEMNKAIEARREMQQPDKITEVSRDEL